MGESHGSEEIQYGGRGRNLVTRGLHFLHLGQQLGYEQHDRV